MLELAVGPIRLINSNPRALFKDVLLPDAEVQLRWQITFFAHFHNLKKKYLSRNNFLKENRPHCLMAPPNQWCKGCSCAIPLVGGNCCGNFCSSDHKTTGAGRWNSDLSTGQFRLCVLCTTQSPFWVFNAQLNRCTNTNSKTCTDIRTLIPPNDKTLLFPDIIRQNWC